MVSYCIVCGPIGASKKHMVGPCKGFGLHTAIVWLQAASYGYRLKRTERQHEKYGRPSVMSFYTPTRGAHTSHRSRSALSCVPCSQHVRMLLPN